MTDPLALPIRVTNAREVVGRRNGFMDLRPDRHRSYVPLS